LDALLKRVDSQSAIINRLQDQLKKAADTPALAPKNPDLTERVAELEAQKKLEDERRQKTNLRIARSAIRGTLSEAGVDAVLAEDLADSLLQKNGGKIAVNEDDDRVTIAEVEGTDPKPIADWVKAFLGTDRGKRYLPAKRNPSVDGAGLSAGAAAVAAQLDSMTRDEALAFAAASPSDALELRTQNPEKWRAALNRAPRKA
jgi:hypothetical protein